MKVKVRFDSYHPIRVGEKWSYTFVIFPYIDFFYLGGIKRLSLCWLFWEVMLDFDPIENYEHKEDKP